MDELTWAKLTEVYGRMQAEVIESYLKAEGIETELFQEAVGHLIYPTTIDGLAKIQIFVPKEALADARHLLERFNQDRSNDDQEASE